MFLLSESRLDRIVRQRHAFLLVSLALIGLGIAVPRSCRLWMLSAISLFNLGFYSVVLQKWRTDPGLWMAAVLLTVLLGPIWLMFEYTHWQAILAPAAANQARRAITWDDIRSSIDAFVALLLYAKVIQLAATVAVENWRRSPAIRQERARNAKQPNISRRYRGGLVRLVVQVVLDLFQSRESILLRFYTKAVRSRGISLDSSASLDDARQRYFGALPAEARPSDFAVYLLESRMVLGSRLCTGWMAFWVTLSPLLVAGYFAASRIVAKPDHSVGRIVQTLALSLGLFLVASLCGLIIQAVFLWPCAAFINWCLGFPDNVAFPTGLGSQERIAFWIPVNRVNRDEHHTI